MKKSLLSTLFIFFLVSCNDNNIISDSLTQLDSNSALSSSQDNNSINSSYIKRTITCDYGNTVSNQAIHLFGDADIFFNIKDYGIEKLYCGDVVTVYYTGSLTFQEVFPSRAILDGEITKIEVLPAIKVYFEVYQVPGGGYQIISDDGKNYIIPDYYIADDTYYSSSLLYPGLRFMGTISQEISFISLDALYAIDFDKSKISN